jgi:preprotein translocase subunit SecF
MRIFTNANYNFIRWRWHAIALSLAIVIGGIATMAVRGMPLGLDFTGGTIVILQFTQDVTEEQVRNAVAALPGDEVVNTYDDPAKRQIMVRLPLMQGVEQGKSLEQGAQEVERRVREANLGEFAVVSRDLVGPAIGEDLQRRGIYATLASIAAIAVYIGFRFRFSFAIGAIAATLHDVIVTLAFLTFFGYDLSLNVVAAILTITGYSVNDTIVVFDRVRENLRSMRRDSLETVVNTSVNQTLARTVITAGTTFLSVFALFLFGGEALEGFAFTMLVGIVSGTYSTVFIASSLAIMLAKQKRPAAATAVETATAPGKKTRRARVS